MEEEKKTVEENPHLYKPKYTREEVDELLRWFEERTGRLPATLKLNTSTFASDLPRTVKSLTGILKAHREGVSVTFCGYVAHLALIRLRLQEGGME